jgi:hypothetical protein
MLATNSLCPTELSRRISDSHRRISLPFNRDSVSNSRDCSKIDAALEHLYRRDVTAGAATHQKESFKEGLSLYYLVNYWSRAWITQEEALARQLKLVTGSDVYDLRELEGQLGSLRNNGEIESISNENYRLLSYVIRNHTPDLHRSPGPCAAILWSGAALFRY